MPIPFTQKKASLRLPATQKPGYISYRTLTTFPASNPGICRIIHTGHQTHYTTALQAELQTALHEHSPIGNS